MSGLCYASSDFLVHQMSAHGSEVYASSDGCHMLPLYPCMISVVIGCYRQEAVWWSQAGRRPSRGEPRAKCDRCPKMPKES